MSAAFGPQNRWAIPIAQYIEDHPGCCIKDMNRDLGVPYDTARINLHKLLKRGLIHEQNRGQHVRRFFSGTGGSSSREKALIEMLSGAQHLGPFSVAGWQVMT